MTDPIRIANCSGFYGDRRSAAREMVEDGSIDALTGDWLAELTMLILARTQAKRPGGGYARTFVQQMEEVMGTCLERGIKVVSNAGGLDPDHCAEAVQEVADRLGLSPTIAYVDGDNLLPRLGALRDAGVDVIDFETGEPVADVDYISANAYLGAWGIVEALRMGADIVVTGRTTDAAIVCGPAAWHHGWTRDQLDEMAGAVVAGHIIECGTQATGGNYSFFTEIDGLERPGFPWAEIASDGSAVIGKHDGTGGAVTVGTVTSQLLYEIGGPGYLGPDVTARFDTIALEQIADDRVRVSNTRGEAPPDTLKVSMNSWGGFRSDMAIGLTGIDIEEKAALVERAFWRACPIGPDDFESVTTSVVRTDKDDPASNEEAVAAWRITVKDPRRAQDEGGRRGDERTSRWPVSRASSACPAGVSANRSASTRRDSSLAISCPSTSSSSAAPSRWSTATPRPPASPSTGPRWRSLRRRPDRPPAAPSVSWPGPAPATRAATRTSGSSCARRTPTRGSTRS